MLKLLLRGLKQSMSKQTSEFWLHVYFVQMSRMLDQLIMFEEL